MYDLRACVSHNLYTPYEKLIQIRGMCATTVQVKSHVFATAT